MQRLPWWQFRRTRAVQRLLREVEPTPVVVATEWVDHAASLVSHDLQLSARWDASWASALARQEAENQGRLDLWDDPEKDQESFAMAVAEDVQQYLHDTFEDTTWPACPAHPNHPLWLERLDLDQPTWRCPADHATYGFLGNLSTV